MSQFLQATVYGLLQGGLLALIAVGFSLVWGVMNVINLAHGAFVLACAYLAYELNRALVLDPFVAMLPTALSLFVAGYAIQRLLVNLIVNAPIFITLLLTFGLELLIVNGLVIKFHGDYRSINTSYAEHSLVLPGDVRVPLGRLLAAALAVALAVGLGYVMRHTRTGLAIVATGMDGGAGRPGGTRRSGQRTGVAAGPAVVAAGGRSGGRSRPADPAVQLRRAHGQHGAHVRGAGRGLEPHRRVHRVRVLRPGGVLRPRRVRHRRADVAGAHVVLGGDADVRGARRAVRRTGRCAAAAAEGPLLR